MHVTVVCAPGVVQSKCIVATCVQDVAQTPVADTIELAGMSVEDSYDGPHLEGNMPACSLPSILVSLLQALAVTDWSAWALLRPSR